MKSIILNLDYFFYTNSSFWDVIPKIGTIFSLIAFLVAVVVMFLRYKILQRRKTIENVAEENQVEIAERVLEEFHISTEDLTKIQKFELAKQKLKDKARQRMTQSLLIAFLALIALIAVLAANSKTTTTSSEKQEKEHKYKVLPSDMAQQLAVIQGDYDKYHISQKALAARTVVDAMKESFNETQNYRVDLGGAKLAGVSLENVDLSNVLLKDADFRGANLKGANFGNSDLSDADFSPLYVSAYDSIKVISGTKGRYDDRGIKGVTNLFEVDFQDAKLNNATFSYSILVRNNFKNIKLTWLKPNGTIDNNLDYEEEVRRDVVKFSNVVLIEPKDAPTGFSKVVSKVADVTSAQELINKIKYYSWDNEVAAQQGFVVYYNFVLAESYCETLKELTGFDENSLNSDSPCWYVYNQYQKQW